MISISIDTGQVQRLQAAIKAAGKSFSREMAAAINATARKVQVDIGKAIRTEVAIPVKESKKPIDLSAKATSTNLSATVRLRKTPRLGLRHFGARQDAKGVSYKIKKSGGRKRANGAFQGPRPGVMKVSWKGNAFTRVGKSRLPIIRLNGVSAWGVYVKNDMSKRQRRDMNAELRKQMERRINLNLLRSAGTVNH